MALTRLSEESEIKGGVRVASENALWILYLISHGYHTRSVDADDDLSIDSSTVPAKKGVSTLATTVTTIRRKEAKYMQ